MSRILSSALLFFSSACVLLASLSTAPQASIQRIDSTTSFTATLSITKSDASSYYRVETSTDLINWEQSYLRFNPLSDNVAASLNANFTLEPSGVNDGESFDFEVRIESFDTIFLKLEEIENLPEGIRFLTDETRNLLNNLHRIGWDPNRFAFGQEFPLSYRNGDNTGNDNLEQSDVKDVVGDHPGVHGSDFEYMLDRSWEEDFHIAAAKRAFDSGAIVTFDWHWDGRYALEGEPGYASNPDNDKILDHVARGDDSRGDVTWFYEDLDRIIELINHDLRIPFVFRPFHEMDGNWFWWGRQIDGGSETYQKAYQLLMEYISERSEYVLFCWSPDVAVDDFEQFYPGDAYVDVIGRDIYSLGDSGRPLSKLTEIIDFAEERGKVAVLSETGYTAGGNSFETGDPDWWTTRILDPITADENAGRIAWVLTWINAAWSGPYVPTLESPQAAKDDFIRFYESESTLFQNEIAQLKVYEAPPQSTE